MIYDLQIRTCGEDDIALLEKIIPTGANQYHVRRFKNQQEGESTYVLAFLRGEPVGHLDLIWDPSSSQEAAIKRLNGCPELNAIAVIPELRSQGIGSKLIRYAEDLAAQRGYRRTCLGVAVDNPRARRLYERLGYEDWGLGTVDESFIWVDDRGSPIRVTERILVLVKTVSPSQPSSE